VRLPAETRCAGAQVDIRRDPQTGDVILARKPTTREGFFAALKDADVPAGGAFVAAFAGSAQAARLLRAGG
jgi:antitoxin VapB